VPDIIEIGQQMKRVTFLDRSVSRFITQLCVVRALTFESLDLETSFLYAGTPSENLGQIRMSMSSGQGQGHTSKKATRA